MCGIYWKLTFTRRGCKRKVTKYKYCYSHESKEAMINNMSNEGWHLVNVYQGVK